MLPTTFLPLLALPLVAAADQSFTLFHRFKPASADEAGHYVPRGTITLSDTGSASYAALPRDAAGEPSETGDGWYQVALGLGDGMLTTSTRACFSGADSQLTLLVPHAGALPSGIEFKPVDAPASGECVRSAGTPLPSSDVNVVVRVPDVATSPQLAKPIVVDQTTGKPAEPEVEKSFLQKYWLPISAALIFIAIKMPDEPPRAAEGGGGGGAVAAK